MIDGSGRFREAFDDLEIALPWGSPQQGCDCTEAEGGKSTRPHLPRFIYMQIITPMHLLYFAEDKEVHCDSHRSLD